MTVGELKKALRAFRDDEVLCVTWYAPSPGVRCDEITELTRNGGPEFGTMSFDEHMESWAKGESC